MTGVDVIARKLTLVPQAEEEEEEKVCYSRIVVVLFVRSFSKIICAEVLPSLTPPPKC